MATQIGSMGTILQARYLHIKIDYVRFSFFNVKEYYIVVISEFVEENENALRFFTFFFREADLFGLWSTMRSFIII